MSADTRKKIYDILKNKTGFMDSYEDFDNDLTTSEDARKKVYEVLRDKTGFNDTYENFVSGISGEVQRESAIPPVKEESGNVVTTVQSPSYPQRAETKERILNNIPDYFQSKGTNLSTLPLPQNTMSAEKPADIPGRIVQDEQQRIQLAERAANDPYMKQQELEHVFKPKNQEQIDSVRQLINSARQQRVKERQQRVKSAGGGGIFSTMSQAYLSGEQNDADKQLEYASTLLDQAQNFTNQAKKKGNTNFVNNLARGVRDTPLDVWAMGLQDLKNYSVAKKVMDKVDRGEELSPSEDALMQALVTNAATQMYYSGDLGRGYKAGNMIGGSLPFIVDMLLGMGTIQAITKPAAKSLLKYATKKATQYGLGKATTGLAKGAARTISGLRDVAAHTATFGGARVAADYQRRGLGDVQVSPEHDGTVSYAGRDNVQTGAEAIGKSIVSTAAETGSELLGEYFGPMLGWIGRATGANRIGKIIPASVGKAYSSLVNSQGFKQVQEIARRAKISDPIGEYGEEVVNNLVSTAIGDMTPEQLVDLDNNIDTFLGVAPMSALFGAAGTGGYLREKYRNYRNMREFENQMRDTMGEDWSGVREALQDADIETARGMVKEVLSSNMQPDIKKKAINYISSVLQEQTLQEADKQIAPEEMIQNKRFIISNLNEARNNIGIGEEELNSAVSILNQEGESALSGLYDAETVQNIVEYKNAYDDYLNYTYWVQNQAYDARKEAESQVERMTNATTGTVMRVKSGLSQNPVNILRGNIAFDAEGNVDKDSSDNTIYYLSEDGKVKMAPISIFESLVGDTPAEELAYQAGEDAEQEFIQAEEAQLMQPEQSVQPIELGTTFQSDGVTYSVTQKSPDGYVVSALDEEGNPVQSNILTEEQIRTAMTPAIQEEQTSQEQVVQSEDVTQPEPQQVQNEPQTAISRIPVNENGEHDFESAPYQDTSSALIEISESVDDAKDTAAQMINHYQEELKKADKAKTTGNTIQEIVRLKQQKKANIQSINDKIAYWNSVANDIESKRPGGIIEQAKEESDANQQRLSEMTAEQQKDAQEEVQKKIDSGAYERKEPRKRARYVNEDNEIGTANTPMEHVLREIATGRVTFNWNDSGETQGLGSHLGLASSPEERRRMIWALSSDGMTPEAAAEQIHADMPENLQGMVTDQDVFNMILDAFHQNGTPSKMWESAKSMHGTDVEESAPGYEDYMEQQALEWEASQNNMTVEEWISYVDYVEEELDNMYSSVSDEDLKAIFEKFNEQIISENESRGNETEGAGSTEGQTDGEQGDELLPEGRGNNEGTYTTVNEQPEPANQTDGEGGSVVSEPGSEVTREKETYDGALNNGNDSVYSQNNLNDREHEQGEVAGVSGESGGRDGKNEAESYLRRAGDRTTAEDGQSRWTRNTLLRDVVQRNKGHQTWIDDIQSIISGERIGLGGENDVYLSRDGKSVVKINDFSYLPENSTNFDSFMNRVDAHNELFPHDAITILGFTLNSDGKVSVVLSQPYISNAREATQEEIDNFLEEMGFYTDMSGNWTDGTYEIADTKPNNVLVDEDGNLHFIDVLPYDSRKPGKMLEIPAKRNAFVAPDIKKGEDVLDYIHRVAKAKEIHDAERETDTNPTEAQKEAGNYKKGHVKVDGFDITIENPKDSVRSGKDSDGKEWSVTMNNDYGYIRGTEGVDGDHIDVFLSDNPEQGNVYVIDQVNQKTGEYDESKVMYGFNSLEEAKDAYLANFEEGWKVGVVSGVSKEEFRKWIESSVRKTKPFSEYKSVKVEEAQNEGIRPDEGVLDYAKRVAEREQKKAKPAKKIDVFSYTDAKSNIPAYRGAYYSDGTVTATNGFILIRLQATYPRENEGKVIDKKGEEVANVRYPKVELIIPKGEQETVTVDKESVRAKLNEIETKLKEEWVKSDKKTPYKTLKAITTIKVNIGGVTHNISIERLTALLDGMDAIGTNQVGITKSIAYAKNGKQLIAVAFNAKDIDDTYDSISISDETYSEDTINQMKRVGVPLTDLEGIPQSEDGMFQIYGIQDVVGETMYFVSSHGKTVKNMDENYVGTGDRMFKSLDEAIKGAEEERASYQRTKADREEREERVRQRIEEERKAQEAKDATPLGKFLKTLNRLQAGKADGILSDNVSFNGETMSKADFIQRVIADGYAAEEYLDGTKIKYRLVKDGKGYKINKTEFDFAKFAGAETIEVENKDDLINLERLSRKYADKGVYTMADIDKRIASTERRLKGTNENGKEGKELKKALEELKELKRLKEMHNSTRTKQEENVESQNTSDEQTNESGLTDSDVEQERTSPKERIEDTGEKIGGARKDIIRKYADKINLAAQTFSKMFPKPEIKALVEAGVPIKDAAAVKAMYDIAKAEYKRRKSTANSVFFAMYAKQVLSGDRSKELVYNGVVFTEYGKEVITANEKAYAALYERLGLDYSDIDLYDFRIIPRSGFDTRIINFKELNRQNQELSERRGKNVKYLDGDKVNFVIGAYHRAENQFETIEDAIDAFVERVKKETKLDAPKYSPSIYWKKKEGYTDYSTTWVGTKIKGFGLVDVKSFKSSSEARKWLAEHQEDFQQMSAAEESRLNEEKKEGVASYTQIIEKEGDAFVVKIKVRGIGQPIEMKRFPIEGERYSRERSLNYKKMMDESSQWAKSEECKQISDEIAQNALSAKKTSGKVKVKTETDKMRERVGEDYRNGRDITANELLDTFGFRAIEFGNYVNQKERQSFLNNIYDSLMDMSKILGISPKGLSLGGKLAIAYGARGKSAASGHYEPYKNVINVTKTSGNGVFAHEWMHALDYYFSSFNPENIYSSAPHATSGEYKSDIRDEVKSSFDNLMSVIKASDYYKRSVALNEYYSSDTELAARALQDYIIRKLEEKGQVNDFLSNHITPEEWSGSEKTYPFPSGKEVESIGEAFNNLFDTIEEKVDEEGNTILFREEGNPDTRFRFIGEQGAANLDRVEEATTRLDNLNVAREMEKSGKDAKSIKIATGWERGADNKWRYEEEDFEYIPKGNAREKSLLEREPWHKELMSLSDKVYNGEKLSNEEEARFDELSKKETELKDSLKKSYIKFLDDYVSDSTLFKEYPELKQVKVEFYDGNFFDGGSYSHDDMTIRINNNSPLDAKSVLVHEVQHAIQHIEGFSKGGNVRTYRNYLNSLKEKRDAWSMINEFEEKSKELGSDASQMDVYKAVRDEYTSLGMSFGDGIMPSRDAFDKGFNLWARGYDKEGYEDAYKEYQNLIEKFGLGESKDRYHELSGEVEARNVQSRLNMTPEERRKILASETEDVAREDQIFLYDSIGANSMTIDENQDLNNIKSKDVKETAKKLNVPVEVITSVDQIKDNSVRSAIEKGRKVKGWYSLADNKVYVYLPNATSMEDVNQTILHEGVAHYGLRQLVGEDRMDDFLDDVFSNVTDEVRKKIIDTLPRYGYNSRIATEEYMAKMAENGVDVSVWQRIKQAFNSLMRRMGINIKISDNELRYILWRSRQNLDKNKPLDLAKDVSMQYQMGVGNYFREVDQTPEQSIIDAWDNIASSTMFSLRESTVDYLTAIDKFQDLISKRTGEEIKSFENAYDSMTFLSSKNRVEMDWFDSNIVSPMKKAILELVGKQNSRKWDWNKGVLRQLVMYVEAKHGVERNRQMAIEKYIKELKPESLKFFENAGISIDRDKYKEDLKKAKEEAGKKAYDKTFQSIYDKLINEGLQKEEAENKAKKRAKTIADMAESNASDKFRNDFIDKLMKEYSEKVMSDWNETKKRISKQKDLRWIDKQRELDMEASRIGADLSQDYSGLSSVFGDENKYPDGWYEASLNFVEEFENSHDETSVGNLWKSISQATDYILNKQYESGLVSREYVDRQKQRFENYIPLRGFQDEIAGDVYNYIGNDFYPGSNPVKSAKGRTSEAGNPFGSILNTGYSTISVGNKNLAKMSLYSLVNNHDTEGLAVSNRAWMVRYDRLMQDDDLREALVIPKLESGEDVPEWVEAVPKYPEGDISAEDVSRILGRFEDIMKKNNKDGYAKPVSKKSRIAYRTLYNERSEHEIPLYILGDKYVITITGNPRVAQAMNGLLNPNVNNKGWAEIGERIQRFMAGAFTAKNVAFSIANLIKDTMYSNNQVFIKENVPYWIKFTKNQKAGFGDFVPMMIRLKKYQDGNLDLSDEINKMFKEFMDNGGATGYTFVDTQENYAKDLAEKLKDLSRKNKSLIDPRKITKIFFDCVEFTGQAAELVNRFAAYKTSRDMGRSVTRSIRDAKEITVNFNRKGAGMKSWNDNKSLFDVTNMAAFFSQYGRAYILFWNANMQAKYRFYKNIKENPVKTSTTLIANSMMFASFLIPFMNNFVLPSLYEMFGIGSGDDDEDYYNTLTDWERTHNICVRLPKGNWLKIPVSPEMSPWYTMGDCIGGAISGQRDLSATDFIKSGIDAISPLSINWSYEGANVLLNVLPTISQPVAQVAMNVNFMGNPIKKQPFTIRQGFSPQYKMVYGNTSPALIELSRLSNKLTGGTDGKTSGSLDWNPSLWQNIITGYTGGYGSSFLSAADWIVSTSKGEEQSSTIGKMPLVSRFFISGNKDVKMRRINSSFYDVIKFTEEFKFDQKSLEDEITSSYKEGNALASEESRKKLEELLRSDRARKYIELENIVNSVNDIEKYMKEMPDDETTQAILYQLKTKGIDILKK